MGSLEASVRRSLAVVAVAALVSACGSSPSHRRPGPGIDGGTDASADAGTDAGLVGAGAFRYFGSTGSSGGTVMRGGGYILFGVTGEVPGTSGLSKSPDHQMVGGVVGRASY